MQEYEVNILLPASLNEKEVEKVALQIEEYLVKVAAKFKKGLKWEKISLAYEIKKSKEAYYCVLDVSLKAEKVGELDSLLKNDNNIIRFLVVRRDT